MKKMLILLLAVGTVSVVSAQSSSHNDRYDRDRDRDVATSRYDNERSHGAYREKEVMIRRVNADFDRKVAEVNSNYRLKKRQKTKLIRQLNKERAEQLHLIDDRFANNDRGKNNRQYRGYDNHR